MSFLSAEDDLSQIGEVWSAAADEAAHLDAHSVLVHVRKARQPAESNARGLARAHCHLSDESLGALCPPQQLIQSSWQCFRHETGERSMGQEFENVRAPEHPQ